MKRICLCLLCVSLLLSVLCGCQAEPDAGSSPADLPSKEQDPGINASTLTEHSFSDGEITLGYLLYTPKNAADGMPLLVYLHGGSGKGADLSLLTANDGFPKYLTKGELGDVPTYVLIPQLPSTYTVWEKIKATLIALIDAVGDACGTDADRISLTGHSMGGTGVWSIAVAYPQKFSCIAPMSGSITATKAHLNALASMPIRAFVGSADTVVDPAKTETFIAALKEINSNATLTVLDGVTHQNVPARAYLNTSYHVIDWLLSNSRGA